MAQQYGKNPSMLFMILYWQSVVARAVEARVPVRVGVVPSRRGSIDAAAQRSTSTWQYGISCNGLFI